MRPLQLLPASLCLLAACGGGEPPRPNVLLVTLDTTRADRMACYGYGKETTPVLDSIAALGWRFDRALSTAGITPVAHASLLTGLWPHRHGLRVLSGGEGEYLDPGLPTLAGILRDAGWSTGAAVSSYPASDSYGLDSGFDWFETGLPEEAADLGEDEKLEYWVDARRGDYQRRADDTTDDALAFLEEQGEDPWCLWVHYFDPHDLQLVPPADFLERQGLELDPRLPGANVQVRERYYDAELTYMDREFGRIIGHLDRTGQLEDTVIVIVADHGQGLLDGHQRHGWFGHRILYDWCLRVPLILRLPGMGSGVVGETVPVTDVLPTLLEVLDLPGPAELDGASLLPLMRGEGAAEPRLALAESLTVQDEHGAIRRLPERFRDDQFCVVDGRWKLIANRTRRENDELYDLEADPGEARNLAAEEPEVLARLRGRLAATGILESSRRGRAAEERDSAALEGLGYTGGAEDGE